MTFYSFSDMNSTAHAMFARTSAEQASVTKVEEWSGYKENAFCHLEVSCYFKVSFNLKYDLPSILPLPVGLINTQVYILQDVPVFFPTWNFRYFFSAPVFPPKCVLNWSQTDQNTLIIAFYCIFKLQFSKISQKSVNFWVFVPKYQLISPILPKVPVNFPDFAQCTGILHPPPLFSNLKNIYLCIIVDFLWSSSSMIFTSLSSTPSGNQVQIHLKPLFAEDLQDSVVNPLPFRDPLSTL